MEICNFLSMMFVVCMCYQFKCDGFVQIGTMCIIIIVMCIYYINVLCDTFLPQGRIPQCDAKSGCI